MSSNWSGIFYLTPTHVNQMVLGDLNLAGFPNPERDKQKLLQEFTYNYLLAQHHLHLLHCFWWQGMNFVPWNFLLRLLPSASAPLMSLCRVEDQSRLCFTLPLSSASSCFCSSPCLWKIINYQTSQFANSSEEWFSFRNILASRVLGLANLKLFNSFSLFVFLSFSAAEISTGIAKRRVFLSNSWKDKRRTLLADSLCVSHRWPLNDTSSCLISDISSGRGRLFIFRKTLRYQN